MYLHYNLSSLQWSFPFSGSFAYFLMDYTYDPAFKCFPSSGVLLGLNKGGLAVWNQLSAVQDIGWEWALSLQRDEQCKVNYLHLVVLVLELWVIWWEAHCHSQSKCSPTHLYMDRSANFLGGEFPFTALSSGKECCSFGMKSQSESSAAWNHLPYVLNLQSPDVPRNECDEGVFCSGSFVAVLLGAELEWFYGNQHLWPSGDSFVKYLKESEPLVYIHLWCFLFLLFQEFLALYFVSPPSRFGITMVWKQTCRNTCLEFVRAS